MSNNNGGGSNAQTGAAFVIGTDAPMASVTSFSVQIASMQAFTANDCSGTGVALISGTPTVDFARFNGLQTLLDMNDVAAGTYNCVSLTLGPATIGYLDTSGSEPTISTETATLSTSTITAPLSKPMTVATDGAPVGIHLDFNLRKSIEVDDSGQITGTVNPTFDIQAVNNSDSGAYIDEFTAAVVGTDSSAQTITIQGPHGRQFTVSVSGQTEWDGGAFSDLNANSIIQVSGFLDRADATIDADEVAILSDNGFYAAGLVTYVTPSSGAASSFDLYVRGTLPATTGVADGDIATIGLGGSEKYSIYWMHGPIATFLFNASGIVPGQHVAVGGPASGASSASDVTVKRVVLRDWGYNGTIVPSSLNLSNGTFQMQVNGFAGLLVPQNITVYVTNKTQFRFGWTALSSVTANANVRVVGVLLRNQANGNLVLVGHYVDCLN